jgi:hypothetical protein
MNPATTAAFNTPPRTSLRIPSEKEARESAKAYMSPDSSPRAVLAAQDAAANELKELKKRLLMAPVNERPHARPRLSDTAVEMI